MTILHRKCISPHISLYEIWWLRVTSPQTSSEVTETFWKRYTRPKACTNTRRRIPVSHADIVCHISNRSIFPLTLHTIFICSYTSDHFLHQFIHVIERGHVTLDAGRSVLLLTRVSQPFQHFSHILAYCPMKTGLRLCVCLLQSAKPRWLSNRWLIRLRKLDLLQSETGLMPS